MERICYSPPSGPVQGVCLFVPSGQMGRYDRPGALGELALVERLVPALARHGVGAVRLDMPLRRNRQGPAGERHLAGRTRRLRQLVQRLPSVTGGALPYALCGLSLGARSVLDLLAGGSLPAPPRGVVLIGAVLEEPCVLRSPVRAVHLVYGADDLIGYVAEVDGAARLQVVEPSAYGPRTAQWLQLPAEGSCTVHILDGLGHTLTPPGADAVDDRTIALLAEVIGNLFPEPALIPDQRKGGKPDDGTVQPAL